MKQNTYGYVRAVRQDPKAMLQEESMKNAGIPMNRIFRDKPGEKDVLHDLQSKLSPGDVLVIKSLNQLGYSYNEICESWNIITKQMKSHIRVLDMALVDTRISNGTLVIEVVSQLLSYTAERERFYIKQRQAEGIAYARGQGKHLGRPRILKPSKFDEIYDKWRSKRISAGEAMKQLGLKRSTFERFVKEKKEQDTKKAS